MTEPVRRRRRVRSDPEPAPESATLTNAIADEPAITPAAPSDADSLPMERGLRGLVGGGSSQVSPAAALRARDAARPRDEDLARAEANLTIVRRHWTPHD